MKKYIERFKEWIYAHHIDSFFAGIGTTIGICFLFYEWNNDWVARIDVIISAAAGLLIGWCSFYMITYFDTDDDEEN